MSNQALSAVALSSVAALTDIHKTDGRIQSAAKFAGGIPLKVATVAFASFETIVRTALLIAALPMKFISPKTFENMTEKTSSAVHTILDGVKALGQVRAKEKAITPIATPTAKTWQETIHDGLKYSYNYCKDSRVAKTVNENRAATAVVVVSALTLIALYYNSDAILNYFQNSELADDASQGSPATPIVNEDLGQAGSPATPIVNEDLGQAGSPATPIVNEDLGQAGSPAASIANEDLGQGGSPATPIVNEDLGQAGSNATPIANKGLGQAASQASSAAKQYEPRFFDLLQKNQTCSLNETKIVVLEDPNARAAFVHQGPPVATPVDTPASQESYHWTDTAKWVGSGLVNVTLASTGYIGDRTFELGHYTAGWINSPYATAAASLLSSKVNPSVAGTGALIGTAVTLYVIKKVAMCCLCKGRRVKRIALGDGVPQVQLRMGPANILSEAHEKEIVDHYNSLDKRISLEAVAKLYNSKMDREKAISREEAKKILQDGGVGGL